VDPPDPPGPPVPVVADERGDDVLVAAHLAGDATAFPTLYRRHRDRAFRTCAGVLHDRAAAADVTQDVFIKLIDKLDRFDGRAAFPTWLHRVLVNACRDHVRRRRPEPVGGDEELAEVAAAASVSDTTTRDVTGDVDRRLDITAALAALPEDQRDVVVLHDVSGYHHDEIAAILDIPEGTVKSRLSRARRKLAAHLGAVHDSGAAGNGTASADRPITHDPDRHQEQHP
jgi:RNA polymerase sigma-70 factor (ECF subfamily)